MKKPDHLTSDSPAASVPPPAAAQPLEFNFDESELRRVIRARRQTTPPAPSAPDASTPPLTPPHPPEPAAPSIPPEPARKTAPVIHYVTGPAPNPTKKIPMSTGPKPTLPAMPTLTDFKSNAERQRREQKSFGNVLTTLTYVILIGLILLTGLGAYGGYVVWERLRDQAQTTTGLDHKYEAAVAGLSEDLRRTREQVDKLNGQTARLQEQLSRLRAAAEQTADDLKQERATRQRDTALLQKRVADLEGAGPRVDTSRR